MKTLILLSTAFAICFAEFSSSAQQEIVDAHNEFRRSIAKGEFTAGGNAVPAASNMRQMSWDSDLAASAQEFADGCPDDHVKGGAYGENLYWSFTSEEIDSIDQYGKEACAQWAKEFQDFGFSGPSEPITDDNGHATQMAWAATSKVGCGAKSCGRDPKNDMNKVTVVCRYTDQGNMDGEAIYKGGEACSACDGAGSCSDSLCA